MACCVPAENKALRRCGCYFDLFRIFRLAFSLSIDFNALASQPVSLTVSPHQLNNNTMRALRLSLCWHFTLFRIETDVRSLILCLARFLSKSYTLYMHNCIHAVFCSHDSCRYNLSKWMRSMGFRIKFTEYETDFKWNFNSARKISKRVNFWLQNQTICSFCSYKMCTEWSIISIRSVVLKHVNLNRCSDAGLQRISSISALWYE